MVEKGLDGEMLKSMVIPWEDEVCDLLMI